MRTLPKTAIASWTHPFKYDDVDDDDDDDDYKVVLV